ncbi:hypothetical protein QTH89_25000 [Variovorax sp. J22G21]|uniref:hypothetical protein n=1 Tax=Variovorax fucosicus TaxID=3053517 RepID=UPI002577E7F6|nr:MULTISPECIES: hypothetical protein [unclassified Variovorax]MDM0039724.1 hypothetical protein [Variovorax sp. J22R193]MDM0054663.1 hypothetical protein [Variovorax sp. J22G47]MDM0064499.1 hypothetical protein [Variovorax sp. J22G21]
MAFSIKNPDAQGRYSIDYTVGHGGVNMRDDVMLAQVCLNITYFERKDGYADRYMTSREVNRLEPLVEDGYCGPLTIARIYQFQNDLAKRGGAMGPIPVKIDGKFDVSPEPGVVHMGALKRVYSFDNMNYVLSEHAEGEAEAHYDNLPQTALAPLRGALADSRKYAKRFK